MYNATKWLAIAALAASALASCGGDPDKETVDRLLTEINENLEAGNYDYALALMDTIDRHYPSQIEARRQVIALRPRGIEKQTLAMMASADSAIVYAQADLQNLEPLMKHIPGDDLEGYYVVAAAYNPAFINTTGVEARVNDADYTYYIVALTIGKRQGISAVELKAESGATATSDAIPADSERRFDIEGSESAVFIPEEVEALGSWAMEAGPLASARIITAKGGVDVKLKGGQQSAFGTARRYADARRRLYDATNRRVMLERRLQIARDQIANTAAAPQE